MSQRAVGKAVPSRAGNPLNFGRHWRRRRRPVSWRSPSGAAGEADQGDRRMLGVTLGAKAYLERVGQEIQRLDLAQVEKFSGLIESAYHAGRLVFIIGNGGSGAN